MGGSCAPAGTQAHFSFKPGFQAIILAYDVILILHMHDVFSKLNMNFFLTEEELNCMRESTNSKDAFAVVVMHRSAVVGH